MTRSRIIVLFVLVGCCAASIGAKEPKLVFHRLGPEDGLSHNTVNAVIQDRMGFLWVGTDDGLNRFDGRGFRVFRFPPAAMSAGVSNRITYLLEDSRQRLWVGTARGLHLLDRGTGEFVRVVLPPGGAGSRQAPVLSLLEDGNGRIWVGAGREVFVRDSPNRAFVHVPLDLPEIATGAELTVTCLRVADSGGLWALVSEIGRPKAFLQRLDSRVGAVESYELQGETNLLTFFLDAEGFRSAATRILTPDGENLPFRMIATPAAPEEIRNLMVTRQGTLVAGSSRAVYLKTTASTAWERHLVAPAQRSWQANHINVVYEDSVGTLWIGTLGGLYFHDPNRKPFVHRSHDSDDPASLSGDAVSAFAHDGASHLWVGTFGGGVDRLDHRFEVVQRIRHNPADARSLPSDTVWALSAEADGTLWVGTEQGLCSIGPHRQRLVRHPISAPDAPGIPLRIKTIDGHPDGTLWLGTNHGLFRHDPMRGTTMHFGATRDAAGLSFQQIGAVLVEDADVVWIGTTDGHLDRLSVGDGRFTHHRLETTNGEIVGNVHIFDLKRSVSGELIFATRLGFGHFDPATGRFAYPILADELPGSVVFSLLEDTERRLWLGTNNGLVRFDPAAGVHRGIRSYDLADGIGVLEYNRHAVHIGPDGRFFFGGMTGFTAFDPDEVDDDPNAPRVALTEIRVLGRGGERVIEPFGLDRLVLGPSDDALSMDFAALSFTNPEKNVFAYRLEGFDSAWIHTGTRAHGRYTHLPPGDYLLRVRAANHDGVWNESGMSLPIIVEPPFWQTWWFRSLLVLAVVIGLVLAYRLRIARLFELERVRLGIAADLHDELGSDLSGIAVAAGMVAEHDGVGERDRRRLHQIQSTARGVMSGLRDIVWYINPEHDHLGAMTSRMRSTAEILLEGLAVDFTVGGGESDRSVDMEIRRNVLLIYKEALHNALRHSSASRVRIEIAIDDAQFWLVVADDGRGFDPEGGGDGSGLGNMRRRARQIEARLSITSGPGGGTQVELVAPLG